jgi:hypothetical protein
MLNPFNEVNWSPDTAARRVFAKSLMIGLPTVAVLFAVLRWWKTGVWDSRSAVVFGGAGFAVGALLYVWPTIAWPFYVVWYGFACCMGFVVGNVVMALIFYGLVTGLGVGKRLFGAPALRKAPSPAAKTYWLNAPAAPDPKRYFSQF